MAATLFYDEGVDRTKKNGVHNCGPFYINKPSGLLLYIGGIPAISHHNRQGLIWQNISSLETDEPLCGDF